MKSLTVFLCLLGSLLTAQHTVSEIGLLNSSIRESSGLLFFNNHLITHNDSGNEPILYEMDTTALSVLREVTITNVENKDWEALTQDETYIYIGDFGNNVGTRTDLAIYRINKNEYLVSDQVEAEIIEFSYEDQVDFINNGNSDWDAEAFIAMQNELVIFTKQWQSQGTVAYSIPKTIGVHSASRIGEINDVGLVTDASYWANTQELFLLGYSSILTPFLIKFENSISATIFDGELISYDLGLSFIQAEGIAQSREHQLYFTSEYFSRQTPSITSEARLFKLDFPIPDTPEEEPNEPVEQPENDGENIIQIYKDNNMGEFIYDIQTPDKVFGSAIFDSAGRLLWLSDGEIMSTGSISRQIFGPGIFYFAAYLNTGTISVPFALY